MKLGIVLLAVLVAAGFGPGVQGRQPDIQIKSLEQRVFDLVNIERVKARKPTLKLDPKLSDLAREHSRAMAAEGFFSHANPQGQGPSERAKSAGYGCHHEVGRYIYEGLGENILQNNLFSRTLTEGSQIVHEWNNEEKIAVTTVRGWMDSPEHKANLLSERYILSGIGIAISSNQKVLITQDFC